MGYAAICPDTRTPANLPAGVVRAAKRSLLDAVGVMMAASTLGEGANAIAFHMTTYKSVAVWDREVRTPFLARFAGAASLVLWAGIIVSGRLIAYNWFK